VALPDKYRLPVQPGIHFGGNGVSQPYREERVSKLLG
jgi:hypothetical protein